MKKVKTFKVGDKVFAKVKGYPAWPATIIEDQKTKYNVKFYGTGETGIVKTKDLFYYLKHKNTFVKSLKRKDYNEAIEEIENAIKECNGTDGDTEENDAVDSSISSSASVNDSIDSNKSNKRKRSVSTDKFNDSHMRKKSATTIDTIDPISNSAKDEKVAEGSATVRNQNENSRTDAVDQSSRKGKPKITTTDDEKEKISTSDSTLNNEAPLETTDLTEEKDVNKNENITKTSKADKPNDMTENIPSLSPEDIRIITDDYLRALIAYAEHVKKNEDTYKKKSVEIRMRCGNELVMAKLPSGKFIGIKYNRDKPSTLQNEYDRAQYDEGEAKTILSLKGLLEEGKCNPEDDPNLFEMNINIDESVIEQIVENELIERKRAKLKWLKIESSLIELDAKIKGCLGLDKAEPKTALECLNLMLDLDIDPLMLKKHPHVVDMVKRLRRYIGNVKEWNLTEDQHEKFLIDAEDVREKAEDVYSKFAQLYNVSPESLFWDIFTEEVEEFKLQVKDMQESQVFALSSEPNSRQAFLDSIDEEEEMKIIVSKMERSNKQEKENSSKVANSDSTADAVVETPTSDS